MSLEETSGAEKHIRVSVRSFPFPPVLPFTPGLAAVGVSVSRVSWSLRGVFAYLSPLAMDSTSRSIGAAKTVLSISR